MNTNYPNAEIVPPAKPLPLWRFSLAELMVFMTLAAVNLVVWTFHPVLGVIATVLILPGGIRTVASNRRAAMRGYPLSMLDQLVEFFYSCFLMLIALYYYTIIVCGAALLALLCLSLLALHSEWVAALIGLAVAIGCLHFPYVFWKQNWPR